MFSIQSPPIGGLCDFYIHIGHNVSWELSAIPNELE